MTGNKNNLHIEKCLPVVKRMLISRNEETIRGTPAPTAFNHLIKVKIIHSPRPICLLHNTNLSSTTTYTET